MNRMSLVAAASALLGTLCVAGETAGPVDLSGVWLPVKQIDTVRTLAGEIPPLRAAARQDYQARVLARAKGKPIPDSTTYCQPDGVPRLMYAMMPFQILQKPGQITFVHEKGHIFRLIRMNEPEPEDPDPIFLGHSSGAWRGGSLVVTSVGFNTLTTLDRAGLPHSEQMRVAETYSLGPGGNRLRLRITIEDPQIYEAPWSTSLEFRRLKGYRIRENVCQLTNPEFKSYYKP